MPPHEISLSFRFALHTPRLNSKKLADNSTNLTPKQLQKNKIFTLCGGIC